MWSIDLSDYICCMLPIICVPMSNVTQFTLVSEDSSSHKCYRVLTMNVKLEFQELVFSSLLITRASIGRVNGLEMLISTALA
jgi:hypothetical protein